MSPRGSRRKVSPAPVSVLEDVVTTIEQAIAEIRASLEAMAAPHEGLRDYARLNIQPETLEEVTTAIEAYDRRKNLLETALAALESLFAYGELPVREIPEAALRDLEENASTIQSALALFASARAETLALDATEPEIK